LSLICKIVSAGQNVNPALSIHGGGETTGLSRATAIEGRYSEGLGEHITGAWSWRGRAREWILHGAGRAAYAL